VHLNAVAIGIGKVQVCALPPHGGLAPDGQQITHATAGEQSVEVPRRRLESRCRWLDLAVVDSLIMSVWKHPKGPAAEPEQLLTDADRHVLADLHGVLTG